MTRLFIVGFDSRHDACCWSQVTRNKGTVNAKQSGGGRSQELQCEPCPLLSENHHARKKWYNWKTARSTFHGGMEHCRNRSRLRPSSKSLDARKKKGQKTRSSRKWRSDIFKRFTKLRSHLQNIQDKLAVGNASQRTNGSVWSDGRVSPYLCKRPVATASVRLKSLARYFSRLCIVRGRNLERRHYGRRHWRIGGDGRIRTPRLKAQCKRSVHATKKWKLHFPNRRWNSQSLWVRTASENTHLKPGASRTRRRTRNSSRKFRRMACSIQSWRRLDPWWWGSWKWLLDDRHHVVPRVNLYMPKEETFPIPTKYIDVTRTTHTSLDVVKEKNIEDYWNVDE